MNKIEINYLVIICIILIIKDMFCITIRSQYQCFYCAPSACKTVKGVINKIFKSKERLQLRI